MKCNNKKRNSGKVLVFAHIALLSAVIVCFLCSFAFAATSVKENQSAPGNMQLLSSFEGGKLYGVGKFTVLELSGTYRQMGRQYGHLLAGPLKEMYQEVVSQYKKNGLVCSDISLDDFSRQMFRLYPRRFQEIAYGMEESSGLNLNQIAVLNEFFDYCLKCHVRAAAGNSGNCSAISVWGQYTKDGALVMGRNFDYPAFYRVFNKYITIVAYNPTEAANSAAVITYPGQIGSIQAFNSRGLILENNDGSSSEDPARYFGQRIPFMIKDLGAILEHSTYEGLDAALTTSRMHYPLIYNIAYPGGAANYEMTTYDVKKRLGQDGLLIGTNHFIHHGWNLPPSTYPDGIKDSRKRHDNLQTLAQKYMGKIDAVRMMEMLDIPLDNGGATPMDRSIYQFVASPAELKIWIKAQTYSGWTEVDLKPLFHLAFPGGALKKEKKSDIVQLHSGLISGKIENGVRVYYGIPYADPPVGKLRWKPPQEVASWAEVRNCTDFSRACPQPGQHDPGKFSEDCLYLNVWTPAKTPDEKLPVMVWIHGGAFNFGSASQPEYNGKNLAQKGVVAVTLNYRLGPLGFLVHPLLSKESVQGTSGNYGLLDQIAALKWVQKNITAFGGNPDRVTIFGQSAGSRSVSLQMISPMSAGLFHRAIAQSGGPIIGSEYLNPVFNGNMANVSKMGEQLAAKLRCDKAEDVLTAMRAKSAQEIIAAADCSTSIFEEGLFFAPVFDGWALPQNPLAAYNGGQQHDVPIIVGSTLNEGNLYLAEEKDLSVEKYQSFLKSRFANNYGKAWEMFPASQAKDVAPAIDHFLTVAANAQPARYVAQAMGKKKSRAYLYRFARRPDTAPARKLGVHHGVDLAYVFGNMNNSDGYNNIDRKLSGKMMAYWVNFAHNGNPNGPGLDHWPAYQSKSDLNLEFADTVRIGKGLYKKESDFISRMLFYHWK